MESLAPKYDKPLFNGSFKQAAIAAVTFVQYGQPDKPSKPPKGGPGQVDWAKTEKYRSKFPKDKPEHERLFVGLGANSPAGKLIDFLRIDFEPFDARRDTNEPWKGLHFNVQPLSNKGDVQYTAKFSACVTPGELNETNNAHWKGEYEKEVKRLQGVTAKEIRDSWKDGSNIKSSH